MKTVLFNSLARQSPWVRRAASALLALLFLWIVLLLFGWEHTDVAYFISSMLTWTYIYSLLQKYVIMDEAGQECGDSDSIGEEVLAAEPCCDGFPFKRKFSEVMETEKLFLNPGLTVRDVASSIGTNRTYLSSYINNELNTTFNDYLNSLRVKEACRILDSGENLSLSEVAERSGFNSLSTFNRAFIKQMDGVTPAQYRRNC